MNRLLDAVLMWVALGQQNDGLVVVDEAIRGGNATQRSQVGRLPRARDDAAERACIECPGS
jgi:hypothetical protein